MTENNEPKSEFEVNPNSVWGNGELDEIEYIKFEGKGDVSVKVQFLDDDPEIRKNQFSSKTFDFEVMDFESKTLKTLSITSMRLMRKLRGFVPLQGKDFCITRKGAGMNTDYDVILITE